MIRFVNISLLFLTLLSLNMPSWAQEDGDLPVVDRDTLIKDKHPSKKAMLYSALLPGAGQVYNHIHLPSTSRRKWNVYWKVPLIYGALGGSIFMLGSQQRQIVELRTEYRSREAGNAPSNFFNLDNQSLILLHNQSQTTRDLFLLGSVLVYVINILDATVEAHFINFDVSDDLSMHIYPTATPNFQLGLGLSLRFKK